MHTLLHTNTLAGLLPASRMIGRDLIILDTTPSTNDAAAEAGKAGAAGGLVIFAERQTSGRGRNGRVWESAAGLGLWFSILLRPEWAQARWSRLTTWAAVGIARGLEAALPGCRAGIKWPNDIYLGGRKAVGILCESVAGPGGYAVIGIGVNVNQRAADFPPDLRDRATSLREAAGPDADAAPLDRHAVAASLLRELDALYPALENDFGSVVEEAESRSVLIGRQITIHGPLSTEEALATGLDPDGGLRVLFDDGSARVVSGGEVSITGWQ